MRAGGSPVAERAAQGPPRTGCRFGHVALLSVRKPDRLSALCLDVGDQARDGRQVGAELIVHSNRKALDEGANPYTLGTQRCCGLLKTRALLDALAEGGFYAAFGGARRDEEKSRAKERVYSFRDSQGQWDPKNQRPEL